MNGRTPGELCLVIDEASSTVSDVAALALSRLVESGNRVEARVCRDR